MAENVAKNTRVVKSSQAPGLSAKSDGNEIWGYAAIWDVVDADNDIIRRGAFARSLREVVPAGKVALMARHYLHGGDTAESIGVVYGGDEDDTGFLMKARIFDTQLARDTREKIIEAPALFGLSVGWRNVTDGYRKRAEGGYEFLEMALEEITVTMLPAQRDTKGTLQAKDETDDLSARVCALEEAIAEIRAKANASGGAAPAVAAHSPFASEIARQKRILAILRGTGNG